MLQHETAAAKSLYKSVAGGGSAETNTYKILEIQARLEADEYVAGVAQACDEFSARVGTIEARDSALGWKLSQANAAYNNATGDNPTVNLVGLAVLATLSRMVVEDSWVGGEAGEAALPMLDVHRKLETNAWTLAGDALTPGQLEEVHELVRSYRARFPKLRYVSGARLPEVIAAIGGKPPDQRTTSPGSLLSLVYLNPLAGLDPTTRAIEQTRELAERAMYYAQRAPMLLGWQVELTTFQLANQAGSRTLLSNLTQFAQSSAVFSKTAEGLPQLVNHQRQAAIDQIFAGVARERTNILADLASQESQLRELLPQVRQTLVAGEDMAGALNEAIQSLTDFVESVSPPDTNTPPKPPDANSPPFNVLDYGKAAGEIGVMAKDLNMLLASLNQSVPALTQASRQAAVDAKAVVNHAFLLGLLLILVLGIVAVVVLVIHRRLSGHPERTPPA